MIDVVEGIQKSEENNNKCGFMRLASERHFFGRICINFFSRANVEKIIQEKLHT